MSLSEVAALVGLTASLVALLALARARGTAYRAAADRAWREWQRAAGWCAEHREFAGCCSDTEVVEGIAFRRVVLVKPPGARDGYIVAWQAMDGSGRESRERRTTWAI